MCVRTGHTVQQRVKRRGRGGELDIRKKKFPQFRFKVKIWQVKKIRRILTLQEFLWCFLLCTYIQKICFSFILFMQLNTWTDIFLTNTHIYYFERYDNGAPQTSVLKYDWISFWELTPMRCKKLVTIVLGRKK